MEVSSHKPQPTPIPVQLSETDFQKFILPHLSLPARGPHCKIGYWQAFNFILWVLSTGAQWKMIPLPKDAVGKPIIHYTQIYRLFAKWSADDSLYRAFVASVHHLDEANKLDLSILHGDGSNTVAKKGGDLVGYSGHKHQSGQKTLAIVDNQGYVLAPMTVAPVNRSDMVLLPDGIQDLRRIAKTLGLVLVGATLNLDSGFDSKQNRKHIFNAGMKPNIKENPRNRQTTKRGRKRLFDAEVYALRSQVERTFAWEDKFRRVILRFERYAQRHLGFKLLAFTLINLREFCKA